MKTSFADPSMRTGPVTQDPVPPLKVLVAVEPGSAGTFGHVEGLVHYLVEQNQQVWLAYSGKRAGPSVPALLDFVKAHGGKCLDLNVGNAPCAADLSAFLNLRSFATEFQPDIIHSHSSKAGVLSRALALSGIKARQLYTPHAYYGLAPRAGLINFFYNGIETLFGRIGQSIQVSEDEKDFAVQTLHLDPRRCQVITIAVDPEKFAPPTPEEKAKARQGMKLPEDVPVLGWMGRINFQKDPHTLYRALGLLARQGKYKCHLLHLGKSDGAETLDPIMHEYGLEAHVTRISYLDDTIDFFRAIDGLILNSRYEGCPSTALEALSADHPVILSQAPGTNWLTRCNLSHCWSARPEDEEGFASAISQWLADIPTKRESNSRTFILNRLSIAQMYGKILETYRTKPTYLSR
jgi:glycosyltransferase involved in cell wall biosynthesis